MRKKYTKRERGIAIAYERKGWLAALAFNEREITRLKETISKYYAAYESIYKEHVRPDRPFTVPSANMSAWERICQ